jgi:hypothetical protein
MSETTTVETPEVETVEQPKQGMLKRFAKAFYAKASNAAKAIKAAIVRNVGDNETTVSDESKFRSALRYVTAVPKWIGHSIVFAARAVLWVLNLVVAIVFLLALMVVAIPVILVGFTVMIAFKVIQGIALLLRAPYLLVRGDDCLKTDVVGYANLWKPRYFAYTRISQVFLAQELAAKEAFEAEVDRQYEELVAPKEEAPVLSVVKDDQKPKGRPTNRQRKHRPARVPSAAALAQA